MNRQIWWQRAAVVLPLIVYASAAFAQKPACEHGVLQLPAQVNAPFEICSALAAQVPGLSQQLAKVAQTLSTQHDQIEKLNRLIGSMNSVSQNLGPERQVQMLNNFASILMASQKGGQEQTERKISALAEGFEQLKDQLVTLLTNRATADKANAAIDGSTGDDIARLDLASAHSELEEIRAQLKAIGSEVGEVNQRVQDIQNSLNLQSMDVGRVSNDLASANVEALNRLTASGVPTNVLEEAFRRKTADGKASVARRFFESSADSPQAMKWFDAAISKGLDPNMTVPGDYYSSEALLIEAMRASNVAAMKVLLARGVNPHPYQDLALTRFEGVRFLFPLHFIADDDHLSLEDKQSLTKAFLDAGVVIPKVLPPNGNAGWQSVMYEVNQLQEQASPKLGMKLPVSPTICQQPAGPLCKRASARTGDDWCSIISAMPKKLDFIYAGRSPAPVYSFELQYLLGIEKNKAYFLALTNYLGLDYILVEVSRDGSTWTVVRFMYHDAELGLCRKDSDSDSFRADDCWERIPLHRVGDQMKLEELGLSWNIVPDACSAKPK